MLHTPLEELLISTAFWGDRVVLEVQGEVDVHTSPELRAVVDAVIDRGHRSVVLDLAKLRFMDAAGLAVIAHAAVRLRPSGARLTIRSPSAMVARILDITGLTAVVDLEHPVPPPPHLGSEQLDDAGAVSVSTGHDRLAAHLRTLTAIPADNDVIDQALQLVVALTRATVAGADGVSVSLRRHGRLATVAASDQTILSMDADQYDTGEGPCVDASVEGRWFHVESLASEPRWPAFTPRAQALGIKAILSSPLRAGDRPVGALNIYSRTAAAFTPADQKLASLFASEASTILMNAELETTDDEIVGRVGTALRARQVIAHAQGMIMQRDGVDSEDAYTVLRRSSIKSGLPLRDQAALVVAAAPIVKGDGSRGNDHRG